MEHERNHQARIQAWRRSARQIGEIDFGDSIPEGYYSTLKGIYSFVVCVCVGGMLNGNAH